MSYQKTEPGLVLGRNYIETLLLTLTRIEFSSDSHELLLRIVIRLEDEVCALSTVMEEVKQVYASTFKRMVKEYFGKDLPLPDSVFEGCNIIQKALDYLLKNPGLVVEGRFLTSVAEERIKSIVSRIGRASVFSTMYYLGLVRL